MIVEERFRRVLVRRPFWIGCSVAALLAVAACTGGSSGGSAGRSTASGSSGTWGTSSQSGQPSGSAGAQAGMPAPAYDQVVNLYGTPQQRDQLRVRVYPLQRIAGALLLTVDFTPVSDGGAVGNTYFDFIGSGGGTGAFKGASLIDTAALVRYGPLRAGSANGAAYSSAITQIIQKTGVTYRLGAFYPDPGAAVDRLSVDLQRGGLAPDVPIVADPSTAPGLVPGLPGAPAAVVRNDLVTWPVAAPASGAYVDRHDLVTRVVGGTVNEGAGGRQGLVTVNADVLFAFDSATVTSQGQALVRQAAQIVAAKADPTQPVSVVGHTDAKGTPAYNLDLSNRRAAAVVTALKTTGSLGSLTLQPQGRGEKQPVAPNTKPDGSDNPEGRALNRRVEIWYTPKPAATPTPTAPADTASATTAPDAAAPTAPGIDLPRVALPVGAGKAPVYYRPQLQPVKRLGRMSLVRFDLTLDAGADASEDFLAALSTHYLFTRDLGAVHLIDPATKRVYVPAYDHDDVNRVSCTYSNRMSGGSPYRYACLTGALPAGLTTVTVSLGPLGTATAVSVQG